MMQSQHNFLSRKGNVQQFTAVELRVICSNAGHRLRKFCQQERFPRYPYILTSRATPQQMRGWLLYHFPSEFYIGRIEVGAIAGRRVNRGVEQTANGKFYNVEGVKVAGMKNF